MLRKIIIIAIVSGIATFFGCSNDDQKDKNTGQLDNKLGTLNESVSETYHLADPTYLRKRMPAEAIAYVRLPHLLSFVSAPKGDEFTRALSKDEHQKLIKHLHEKLYETLANETQGAIKPLVSFWLEHTRTPIEIIVMSNERQQPIPRILLTTQLGFDGREAFAKFVKEWSVKDENLFLVNDQIIKEGFASLASGPVSIELEYDDKTKQLKILAGMGVNHEIMNEVFSELTPQDHPMLASEKVIDSSHYGLFAWFNIENILAVAGNTMPPDAFSQLNSTPVVSLKSLSAGIGISNGKGRLKIIVDTKPGALSNFFPTGHMNIALEASGEPEMLAGISLPSIAQMQELEKFYLTGMYKDKEKEYQELKKQWTEATSISPEEFLTAIGPEVLYLQDELGIYNVITVRDMDLYRDVLARWVKHSKLNYSTQLVNGTTIHYLQGVPFWTRFEEHIPDIEQKPILRLLMRAKTHIYWIEEGNSLVFASVPQALIDRHRYKDKVNISDWLTKTQRQDVSAALMFISTRIKGSPKKLYYAYLQALLLLSDISDAKIDIATLPTALEANLPSNGTYATQLSMSDRQIFVELIYESNPAEFVLGQNLGNVAVVGILAAIAIPAYQDYTIRANVGAAYAQTRSLRRQIEEFYLKNGKYPAQKDIDTLITSDIQNESLTQLKIIPETGELVIILNGQSRIQGKQITVTPRTTGRGWHCHGEIQNKYFPPECRE